MGLAQQSSITVKVAFDISPLESGHKVRGVGSYVRELQKNFTLYAQDQEFHYIQSLKQDLSKYDVLHIPYFDPFSLTLPFTLPTKTAVTVHDLTPIVFPHAFPAGVKGNLKWQFNKLLLKKVDAIIADSVSSQKDIVRLVGVPKSKVHVVYLSAAEHFRKRDLQRSQIEAFRKKFQLPDRFVLYVGDATWNKNLPRLVDAIKEINLTLVLAGKAIANTDYDASNPWNRDLQLAQEKMNGDKRFIQLGYVSDDDLVMLYNVADVCVLPSLYEGFGLPVLEAMSCGCPVVTTKKGSLSEVAEEAAYYIDPQDVSNIANGIGEVFFTDTLRNRLITEGLRQTKKFTWKKTVEDTVNVYQQIMSTNT